MMGRFSNKDLKELHQLWHAKITAENACLNIKFKDEEEARTKYYKKLKELDMDFRQADNICWHINNNFKEFYKEN